MPQCRRTKDFEFALGLRMSWFGAIFQVCSFFGASGWVLLGGSSASGKAFSQGAGAS